MVVYDHEVSPLETQVGEEWNRSANEALGLAFGIALQ